MVEINGDREQQRAGIRAEIKARAEQIRREAGRDVAANLDQSEADLLSAAADVLEEQEQEQEQEFENKLSGYVSSTTAMNFAAMVPIIGVGALFLVKIFRGDADASSTLYVVAAGIALVVSLMVAVISWPGVLPTRSRNARATVAACMFLLNALALGGAAVGLGEVIADDGGGSPDAAVQTPPGSTPEDDQVRADAD